MHGYFKITTDDVSSDVITFFKEGYQPDTARTMIIHSGEQMQEHFKSGRDTVFLSPVTLAPTATDQHTSSTDVQWPISSKRFANFYQREPVGGDHQLVVPKGFELASYDEPIVPVHESPFGYDIKPGDRYVNANQFHLGEVNLKVIIYTIKGENDGRVLNIQLNSYNPNGQLQDALLLDSRFTFEVEYHRDFVIQKNGSISITSYSKDHYTYNEQGDITGTLENAKTESSTVVYHLKPDGKFQRID
ncbi:hypothetical protein LLH06_13185 [Mucilaginibacter daejeonensis]|uniref:hypothetical protein n=1 Tax=Mucilaginibacter daejeonensis TaxID=398049 RepID=UPI001D17B729|nr:hypothetical protein [Mucilaginibacter daejeonensis]UEG51915.1 hypothetical protein LLH06_13185 [Mucilaginibacter daejeonensis]